MKTHLPPSVVETWIFIATSQDKALEHRRGIIQKRIDCLFGSLEIASIYVEELTNESFKLLEYE